MCWLLVQTGKDPCDGCNYNRVECSGRYYDKDKYDSEIYRTGTWIDNYIERKRQEEYEAELQELQEKQKRIKKHTECNAKMVLSITNDIGRNGKYEIELKVNDLINEHGYVKTYENIDDTFRYMPAIVARYKVDQIQCEINGFGIGMYDRIKNMNLNVDIVPLRYMRLRLDY